MMPWILSLIAFVGLAAILLQLERRRNDPAALLALESVSRNLGQLQGDLRRVAVAQDELRRDVQQTRDQSMRQLAEATLGIRDEIGTAQRALAEVKALEQGRALQMEQASSALRRLEAVVAGSSSRGAAGENILARALSQLPPDMLDVNVAFGSKIVEYALRLPGGRVLPIDSKWTSAPALERLGETKDPLERRKLQDTIARDLRSRVREMAKYLDPERTLSLALLAVPDAVYGSTPDVHGEAYREGILVVPYSLALQFVLALYRLTARFGANIDTDLLAARLGSMDEALRRLCDEVEGRLSRSLVQIQNSRDALREHVLEAQQMSSRLLRAGKPQEAAVPAIAVGETD